MQELFILPGDLMDSPAPGSSKTIPNKVNATPSAASASSAASVPDFAEFVMEPEQTAQKSVADSVADNEKAKTRELPAVDLKSVLAEIKKAAPSQPPANTDAVKEEDKKEKKQEEIKTLDDLLSSFSVPTINKAKDEENGL